MVAALVEAPEPRSRNCVSSLNIPRSKTVPGMVYSLPLLSARGTKPRQRIGVGG
jgi:hypothetical protein